jgi:hypothetical protein
LLGTGIQGLPSASSTAVPVEAPSGIDGPSGWRDAGSTCWSTPEDRSSTQVDDVPVRTWRAEGFPASWRLAEEVRVASLIRVSLPVRRSST